MKGVRKDRYGLRAYVKVGTQQREKRFPFDTPAEKIKAWRDETRVSLRAAPVDPEPEPAPVVGLAADVERYLELVRSMPTYAQRKEHLELWVDALGADAKRASLTPEPIRLVLQDWRAGGMSAATCNKRRTALMHLFSVLDGKDARNPVRAVPKFPVDDPLPRGRDYAVIRTRLDAMVDSKTKARLLVMLWTGMRPIEVMRAKPEDLHWKDRYVIVRTAKRGRTRTVGLTAKAVKAWRLFDALDAWGTFTLPPMNRMVKKACKMADVSVYDMRHSYGTALARSRVRLDVIGALMGHSSLELTKRYTLAAVSPEAAEATKRLARAGNRSKKLAVAAGSR